MSPVGTTLIDLRTRIFQYDQSRILMLLLCLCCSERCRRIEVHKDFGVQTLQNEGDFYMSRYITKGIRAFSCAVVFFAFQFASVGSSHAQIVALGASVVQGYGVGSGEAF